MAPEGWIKMTQGFVGGSSPLGLLGGLLGVGGWGTAATSQVLSPPLQGPVPEIAECKICREKYLQQPLGVILCPPCIASGIEWAARRARLERMLNNGEPVPDPE